MKMVDMQREEGEGGPELAMPATMPYPYGLRFNLTMDELSKLGYDTMPPAGTMVRIEAVGCVTRSATEDPDADGDIDYCCVEIQVTQLGVEEEAGEPELDDDEDRAGRMYGKKG